MSALSALLTTALDLLSPPLCAACGTALDPEPRAVFCPACELGLARHDPRCCAACGTDAAGASGLCAPCTRRLAPLSEVHACFAYAGPLEKAIPRLKYQHRHDLAAPLGRRWRAELQLAGRALPEGLFLPVPLHRRRLAQRGFDQAWLLTRALLGRSAHPRRPRWVRRARATAPQVGLGRAARLSNLRGAFVADPRVRGLEIVLVDDVLTTGATLSACAEALQQAGAARISALVLARAEP